MRVILIAVLLFLGVTSPAKAELRLEQWKTYGAMAEQGGLCGAFARIMELQQGIDPRSAKLWLERRNYSGAVIREASILEGVPAATSNDIDALINTYIIWLISSLSIDSDVTVLDPLAHDRVSKIVAGSCTALFARADERIFERAPDLATCKAPPLAADGGCSQEQRVALETQVNQLLKANETLRKELARQRAQPSSADASLSSMPAKPLKHEPAPPLPHPKPATIVQLGAFETIEQAASGIVRLRNEFPTILADIHIAIVQGEVAGSVVVTRLVTQRIDNDRGKEICSALWQAGHACLLRANP